MAEQLFDVVGVSLGNEDRGPVGTVRLMSTEETEDEAKAIISMAVMRRGVVAEFFAAAKTGAYRDGDQWAGRDGPKK